MDFSEIENDLKNVKVRKFYRVWEPFMRKYDCRRVCELGVYKGDNFQRMIVHQPEVAVAVDLWKDDGIRSHNDVNYTQAELESQYKYFKKKVKGFPNVQIIRNYTIHAAKLYPDNYFDFVYIDADHSYEGSYTDIITWYAKVKPGKFLVGHDYRKKYGVFEAVNKFVADNKLTLIFLSPSTWAIVKKEEKNKLTELCEIGYTYGTDKCPQLHHFYTPFYFEFLKEKRQSVKKVLEFGIGYPDKMIHISNYTTGASLRMWRDFFPNAWVYGADISKKAMFTDERITTFVCDENSKEEVEELIRKIGTDIDLFIDDASHHLGPQKSLCKTILPLLKDDAIYIIEDVRYPRRLSKELADFNCYMPNLPVNKDPKTRDSLLIVSKKQLKTTELCEIAYTYGTDKCPQLKHSYTPYYHELFKDRRQSIKKVLELGIGHYINMQTEPTTYDRGLQRTYHKGASLKMWRDYFPHAKIYGADVVPEAMFTDTRIKTYLCDERKKEDLEKLIKDIGSDIDIVIDDASHRTADQIFCAQTLLPLLSEDTIYIIEDVSHSRAIRFALTQSDDYDVEIPPISKYGRGDMIVIVRKKTA